MIKSGSVNAGQLAAKLTEQGSSLMGRKPAEGLAQVGGSRLFTKEQEGSPVGFSICHDLWTADAGVGQYSQHDGLTNRFRHPAEAGKPVHKPMLPGDAMLLFEESGLMTEAYDHDVAIG